MRDYLALDVPGLAEGRPSVLLGDRVILSEPAGCGDGDAVLLQGHAPQYEGVVHEVQRVSIFICVFSL